MQSKFSRNLFGVVCLSSAAGMLFYWVMFINLMPRLIRPEALAIMPFMSGVIGAVSFALFCLGINSLIASLRVKPTGTLVLRRDADGRVISIGYVEAERVSEARATSVKPAEKEPQVRVHKRVKRATYVVALIALVLSFCVFTASLGFTAQDLFSGAVPLMAVASGSMTPTLNPGDLIVVRRVRAQEVKVGDIIAFNVPKPYDRTYPSPTVHRVVSEVVNDGVICFKTKGDKNPFEDPWTVSSENIIGKYVFKVPYVGWAALFIRTPHGLAVTLTLTLLYLLYSYHRKRGVSLDG